MREEEIEIGRRMTLVSGRMREEVTVLLENLDSRKGMSAEELREVIKTGLKTEAVEETMTGTSDTLAEERKERKEEEERT